MGGRTVGVMGGMGTLATIDFFQRVAARAGASVDQDHVHLIIDNDPSVPDRNEAIRGTGPSCASVLVAMARRLQGAGVEVVVMACNAAHAYEQEVRSALAVPFISIVEVTCDALLERYPNCKRAGILAATGCIEAGLYQTALARRGVGALVLEPDEQQAFMALLYRTKGGDAEPADRRQTAGLAEALTRRGAEVIIAACTELPLLLAGAQPTVPLIDSADVLADAVVCFARGAHVSAVTGADALAGGT